MRIKQGEDRMGGGRGKGRDAKVNGVEDTGEYCKKMSGGIFF
jgi:hypothetical protein